jgi:transposase-like protein
MCCNFARGGWQSEGKMKSTSRPAIFKWRQTAPAVVLLRRPLVSAVFALAPRGLEADYTSIWRWVQRYGPELEQRLWRNLKPTNQSWRVYETYVRRAGPLLLSVSGH